MADKRKRDIQSLCEEIAALEKKRKLLEAEMMKLAFANRLDELGLSGELREVLNKISRIEGGKWRESSVFHYEDVAARKYSKEGYVGTPVALKTALKELIIAIHEDHPSACEKALEEYFGTRPSQYTPSAPSY